MNNDFLPDSFKEIDCPISTITSFNPKNIAIVGSYGNPNKIPNIFSDIDLVFIFETNNIFKLYNDLLTSLQKIKRLVCEELGVHYQFGYTINIYYEDNSQKWIDIGVMDCHFATNYMINLPKKDVYGNFFPQKNKQLPSAHISQLGRKINICLKQANIFNAKILAYRYLSWIKVENDIINISNKNKIDSDFLIKNFQMMNDDEVLNYVIKDIKKRKL